jgi:hypothetical protein
MPEIIYTVQEILLYLTTIIILIAVINGLNGSSQVRMFEKKHLSRLKLISSFSYLNLFISVAISGLVFALSDDRNPNQLFGIEIMLLFAVSVCTTLGVGKIKNTLVHGKKYRTVLIYFGIALLLMLALIVYLKLLKDAGFIL